MPSKSFERFTYYWPSLTLTLAILVAWEVAFRLHWISAVYFTGPTGVALAFWKFVYTGEIVVHAYASFWRFAAGLAIGAAAGIALGILTGWYVTFRRSIEPIINALYGMPKIAILPLLILLLGTGEIPKITVIAISAFFPIWGNTHAGTRNVDRLLVRAARNFGANELQVLAKVVLPSLTPYIVSGLRLGLGQALVMIIAAELLAAKSGLGYVIDQARQSYQIELLLSLIFLFGFISLVLLKFMLYVERRVTPWRANDEGK